MRIYVYLRPNGTHFADISREYAARNGKIVADYVVGTYQEVAAVQANPGKYCTDRVLALAERAKLELDAKKPPPPEVREDVRARNLWGRLKWALTRK